MASAAAAAASAADPYLVRNTCIMAHVDHGKTTLADHLVAGGGDRLLHPKLAGSVRFMDHLEEEQRRAITMKSASVALRHGEYRVHLIDSPGHIDFCSEVSAAARLADSALILVDAAEGVHIQTHAALRQAFVERLRPCLVINKLDRLVTELRLSPEDAYARLQHILAEVNSIYSALRSGSYFSSLLDGRAPSLEEEEEEEEDAFLPHKGNVVFACAREGWGFRIHHFADLYAVDLTSIGTDELRRALWGPHYFNKEEGKVVSKEAMPVLVREKAQPMFVEFVLKRLWKLYERSSKEDGATWLQKNIVKGLNIQVPVRDLQSKDPRMVLQAVLRGWLPLAKAVMDMLVQCTPDPIAAQAVRVARLMPERELVPGVSATVVAGTEMVRRCVAACSTSAKAPVVVFVSKMFAVPYKTLPLTGGLHGDSESEECFLAFARVFSGVLRPGQKVFVLSPLYDPSKGEDAMRDHVQEVELHSLYEMLGQGLRVVDSVSAGNVVAIQGLGQHVLKNATLSSTKNCWPFSSMMFQVSPMLKVAVEPSNPADMGSLVKGLKLLNRADPFVEYTVSHRGEHVLAAAGQVHLEHCVKNLQERFAKVQLEVSKPLVSFKETIQGEGAAIMDSLKAPQEFVERSTPNGRFTARVKVFRLPNSLTKVLEESKEWLAQITEGKTGKRNGEQDPRFLKDDGDPAAMLRQRLISAIDSDLEALSVQVDAEKIERYRKTLLGYLEKISALGPSQIGPNFLFLPDAKSNGGLFTRQDGKEGILVHGTCHVSDRLGFVRASDAQTGVDNSRASGDAPDPEALRSSIVSGFQFATNAGPLCDEPTWGLAFIVEPYIFSHSSEAVNHSDQHNIFCGQVITAVREACRAAVLQSKPRLVEPIYFCELTTPAVQLGALYAVLGECRARVLKEEMQEGTSLFIVHAHLPVVESSEFSEKLRNATSGAGSALLAFSHWEAICHDPLFIPKTQDEIEEFGDGLSIGPNLAKRLMNSVRRRKGLHVEEKVVKQGTKQRTLGRKV